MSWRKVDSASGTDRLYIWRLVTARSDRDDRTATVARHGRSRHASFEWVESSEGGTAT